MKTLAFDTSTKFLSVALLENNDVRASYHEDIGIRHGEILVPTIKDMLEKTGWKIEEIGLICVGLGPGSFTGLRIAAATVKGFAAVLKNKVVGVPTMDAMIMNFRGTRRSAAPLLDARKGKVYSCIYERRGEAFNRTTDYLLMTIDELLDTLNEKVVFFGDAIEKYRDKLNGHPLAEYTEDIDWYPKAADLGCLGLERSREGSDAPGTLAPLYLHARECNISK
ncbi:MAG: tRNA (adenosine(37)-N6)-threonylcarbamoyltransferase complex dimerization subunit type 1 TsaB [Candidatus Omnitrophota bacterium]|nr:tRNA (adenosine(37)-N6)-threonylcarbamoyltransferase complex dimerization subunit type 1 TsaB [Candidatus Omnitrophota bacterium]